MLADEALLDQLLHVFFTDLRHHIELVHVADAVSPVQMLYLAQRGLLLLLQLLLGTVHFLLLFLLRMLQKVPVLLLQGGAPEDLVCALVRRYGSL